MQLSYNYFMIVFDASTVILLAKIDMLDTFISSFKGKVMVPAMVRDEICIEGSEETPLIVKLFETGKINVLKVRDNAAVKKLTADFNIDKGEAEALTLALHEKADIIATDDRNAIRACKILKKDFTTAISILIRAFEKKLIGRDEAMARLQKLSSVARYGRAIIDDAKKQIKGGV